MMINTLKKLVKKEYQQNSTNTIERTTFLKQEVHYVPKIFDRYYV